VGESLYDRLISRDWIKYKVQPELLEGKVGIVIAAIVLALSLMLIFWRYLFTSSLIYPVSELGSDLNREVVPLARYIVQTIQQGNPLPLWRTYHLSGAPIAGHPVAPIFYPPTWICLFLPLPLALNLLVVGHLWWAGLGTFVFMKDVFKLHWHSCLIAALVFALAPRWVALISGGHWQSIMALAWWPWACWVFARFWQTKRPVWGLTLGVCLAAQALTDGRYLFITLACLAIATLSFYRWKTKLNWSVLSATLWVIAGVICLGLAAVQTLPFLELLPYSTRSSLTEVEANAFSLPIYLTAGVLFPLKLKFPEWYLYTGVSVIMLSIWSLAKKPARQEMVAWMAIGIGLLLSLGDNSPLYTALLQWVPGFGLFRIPSRWWLLSVSGLAVLSGWAVEKWLCFRSEGSRGERGRFLLLVMGTIYIVVGALEFTFPGAVPFDVSTVLVLFALITIGLLFKPSYTAWAGLAVLILLDSWNASLALIKPVSERQTIQSEQIATTIKSLSNHEERFFAPYEGLTAADLVVNDLSAVDGYDSFQLMNHAQLANLAMGCWYNGYAVTAPATKSNPDAVKACPDLDLNKGLLAALNARLLLLPSNSTLEDANAKIETRGYKIYDLEPNLGRGFGVSDVLVTSSAGCFDQLAKIDARTTGVVEVSPPFQIEPSSIEVESLERTPNLERFRVRSEGNSILIRSESWAPGWQVAVNGKQADLLRADCALQGVWLQAGNHEIIFEYAPQGYIVGRAISLITLIIVPVVLLISQIKTSLNRST